MFRNKFIWLLFSVTEIWNERGIKFDVTKKQNRKNLFPEKCKLFLILKKILFHNKQSILLINLTLTLLKVRDNFSVSNTSNQAYKIMKIEFSK